MINNLISFICLAIILLYTLNNVHDHQHIANLANYVQKSVDYRLDILTEQSKSKYDLNLQEIKDAIVQMKKEQETINNALVDTNYHLMTAENKLQLNHEVTHLIENADFHVFNLDCELIKGDWICDDLKHPKGVNIGKGMYDTRTSR